MRWKFWHKPKKMPLNTRHVVCERCGLLGIFINMRPFNLEDPAAQMACSHSALGGCFSRVEVTDHREQFSPGIMVADDGYIEPGDAS